MAFLSDFDISGYGLSAQRFRMNLISSNIANANTSRTAEGGPYRRREVVFKAVDFGAQLNAKLKENQIIIQISDNGKGIENVDMAKEPLYTTKPNLERSGMGFTIMESFMDEMKIESVLGLGTKITMKKTINKEDENNKSEKIDGIDNVKEEEKGNVILNAVAE